MNFFNKYFPSQEAVQLWDDSIKMNEQLQFIVDWAREQNFDVQRYTEDVFSVLREEIKNYPHYEENNRQGELNKKLFEVYYSVLSMYLIVQESKLDKLKDYVKLFDIKDRYALSVEFSCYEHWNYSIDDMRVQEETQCIFEQAQLKMGLIVYVYFRETKYF